MLRSVRSRLPSLRTAIQNYFAMFSRKCTSHLPFDALLYRIFIAKDKESPEKDYNPLEEHIPFHSRKAYSIHCMKWLPSCERNISLCTPGTDRYARKRLQNYLYTHTPWSILIFKKHLKSISKIYNFTIKSKNILHKSIVTRELSCLAFQNQKFIEIKDHIVLFVQLIFVDELPEQSSVYYTKWLAIHSFNCFVFNFNFSDFVKKLIENLYTRTSSFGLCGLFLAKTHNNRTQISHKV